MTKDSDDALASGASTLSDGKTEDIVAEARKTIARARAEGRDDIAQAAQKVIEEITAAHTNLEEKHQEHIDARTELAEAEAEYERAVAALKEEERKAGGV
ncbi:MULTISPECIES: hypothetical protein [Nocardiaceae]|uniref:hypothetical protein n=1 Tax=Nocardiaceae TaxID=85025 RepID=UPI000481D52A|nr:MULTISPECIES: hypothetical protein [Rhodococcus]